MKNIIKDGIIKLKNTEKKIIIFIALLILGMAAIIAFLNFYVKIYQNPYMRQAVVSMAEGWDWQTEAGPKQPLLSLRAGPSVAAGETLTLTRTMDVEMDEAAVMIRANHQSVDVYLDGRPLYIDPAPTSGKNPGMALHFIPLPTDYVGGELKVELTSPYSLYSGRTSAITLGSITSLEAHTLSLSMRAVVLMAVCMALGFAVIFFVFLQAAKGSVRPANLSLGIFAIIWALYYVCTEFIAFQFFSPQQMTLFSIGLYILYQAPLSLFFYFSFKKYRKWMLPAVVIQCGFVVVAFSLQFFGIRDFPELLNFQNPILYGGILCACVIATLEAINKNRIMFFIAPLMVINYIIQLYNLSIFYLRNGVPPYSTIIDAYFLLVLFILAYNIGQFFRSFYKSEQENEILALQHGMAMDSYERVKDHLQEIGGLKHEIRNHLTALSTLLRDGRHDEAAAYLDKYKEQSVAVTEAIYHKHYIINALVGELMRRAKEADIKCELELKAVSVGMSDPDLYSLLSNIINNAMEACQKMAAGRERFIHLKISRREPYLTFICENSMAGTVLSEDGKIKSAKSETGHGYGLWMIGRIAENYAGHLDYEHDGRVFSLMVAVKD